MGSLESSHSWEEVGRRSPQGAKIEHTLQNLNPGCTSQSYCCLSYLFMYVVIKFESLKMSSATYLSRVEDSCFTVLCLHTRCPAGPGWRGCVCSQRAGGGLGRGVKKDFIRDPEAVTEILYLLLFLLTLQSMYLFDSPIAFSFSIKPFYWV